MELPKMIKIRNFIGGRPDPIIDMKLKWKLVTSHTARRSFATNAYKAGVPMPSIVKITGHKKTTTFLNYIKLDEREHAW